MKLRKTPKRTCIACHASDDKRGLTRFVRMADGTVSFDDTGRAPGRGAYLCKNLDCFETARQRRRFDAALKVRLNEDDYDRLKRDFAEAQAKEGSGKESDAHGRH